MYTLARVDQRKHFKRIKMEESWRGVSSTEEEREAELKDTVN